MSRKLVHALVAVASFSFLQVVVIAPAQADAYPEKSVRLVVPFGPGGPADLVARLLASALSNGWKQQVIVDNKPGAQTVIGASEVARARNDGYTLLLSIDSTLTMNQFLFSKLPYNPTMDFAHISLLTKQPLIIATAATSRFQSISDLVAASTAKPGEITYGAGSVVTQLGGELLNDAAKIKLNYVPYKGSAETVKAVLSSEIDINVDGMAPNIPLVKGKHLRALAITALSRSPALPDVPTLDELGYKGFEVLSWLGLSAPVGTPAPVLKKIEEDVQAILARPETREKLLSFGLEAVGSTPREFVEVITTDSAKLGPIIKRLGLRFD
jgi:tripartite-type tricarboxylate transporter receptor subunit TctC